jgi:hypothetical protein
MSRVRSALPVVAVIVCGFLGAATLGYAAYVVSRDSVGIPVTKLDTPPQNLAPVKRAPKPAAKRKAKPRTVVTPPPPPAATTVESGDDHGGSRGGSGDSGGGHGGDD